VGAVDYVFKPFQPEVLRGKVAVFVELHRKNAQLRQQAELLALREISELRRESAERYRQLADAMPQIVWTADPSGATTYYNRRFAEYTGADDPSGDDDAWIRFVHPKDLADAAAQRSAALETGRDFEAEYRLRAAGGAYRWHLVRALPIRGAAEAIDGWIATATDI